MVSAQAMAFPAINTAANIPPGGLAASIGVSFDGVGLGLAGLGNPPFAIQFDPPDPSGAAGLTQYVQWVNGSLAVFRKTDGLLVMGPVPGNTLWGPLGGPCSQFNTGDPIVLYDKLANRWLLAQLAVVDPAIGPFFECIAVSKTSDATGALALYQFQFVQDPNNPPSTTNPPIFNDFPKFGIMPDAYYASYNTFTTADSSATATGERACAYDRNAMLNGDPTIPVCFQLPFISPDIDNTILPADLDGTTLPPSGTPGYFLGMDFSTSSILLYRLHVDFTTTANSTIDSTSSRLVLPPNQPGVDNFSAVCFGLGVNCITQPGTTNTLSAVSDRSGYRFAYRNFGDHEAFVLTHTVQAAFQDTNEPTDVAWWELRKTGAANPLIFQSDDNFNRVAGPGANINRWLSSVAMDKTGDMLLGYSISAGNDQNDSTVQIHPSIGLQGRSRTDALGTTTALNAGEVVMTGNGSITDAGDSRWGDYSEMTLDPVDDCTFWYTNEYISANTVFLPQWSTRILSVKFPSCVATPDFSISATPTGSVIPGTSTTYTVNVSAMAGFTGTVALSASGLPTGVTGTFNPTTIPGGGTSTLTVSAATTASAGDFSFNITGTSGTTTLTGAPGAISHSSTVTMAVNDFSLSGTPTTRKIAPGNAGTFTIGLAWLKDFGQPVTLSIAGQPPLSQVSFSPGTITQTSSSTLTITTDPSTALGDYPLTITGTHASGAQRTVIVHLDLTNFTASASPASQTTPQGGSTSYTVSLADVGGFGFSDPVTLSLDPATLPAGVQGTFSPNPIAGLGSSTLTVTTTNATPQGAATLTIKATDGNLVHSTSVGLTVGPFPVAACVSPNSLTFTGQNVGTTSAAQILTLTSCGTSALTISTISASGDFSQTNNCPASLAANASCAINVTFRPTATGSRTGTLSIADNAVTSPQSISLTGTGTTPAVGLSPTSLTFAAQNIGSTSAAQTVTLNNSGTGPLSITSIAMTGDFAQTNNCGATLAVNGNCAINVSFTPTATGTRSGTLSVNDNAAGSPQSIAISGTGKVPGLNFIPVTPCRIADTRNPNGPFGGPFLSGGAPGRAFAIPSSACNIPSTAQAYSLNLTVVPHGPLGFLTMFPCGPQPATSTLNSTNGQVKALAAIVAAGTGGAVCAFASNDTDLILDINGYFVTATTPSTLAFYPVAPCRLVNTQSAAGPLGGPFLTGNTARSFPLLSGSCNIPSTAQAYFLNYTIVPSSGPVGFLTTWPTGQAQPAVSTLNVPIQAVTSNAAIVQAGTNGAVSVFVSNDTNLQIDITGYFAPPASGGLSFFNLAQCRVLDTRNPAGSPPFIGQRDVNVQASACGVPATAQSYVLNATAIPVGALNSLTLWAQGAAIPVEHLFFDAGGAVISNMAIVPTTNGSISAFATNQTHLLLDISGYFAP
jgi:hypothetical protein